MKNVVAMLSLVVGSTVALAALPALAQERVMVTASVVGDGPAMGASGRISKGAVEAYAKLLGMSEEQKTTAMTLHDGYDAEYSQATKEFSAAMEEMRRSAEESDDHSVFMEKMPKAREELSKKTKNLEKRFMNDLKDLLNTDQQPAWGKVERHRRRDVLLRPGSVSGEGVNLLETVEGLKLSPEVAATLSEALAAYETDMDRVLQAKQKMQDDQPPFEPGKGFDVEAFQARMKSAREAGLQVREVNQTYQRRIENALAEDKRPAFTDAVKRATYPQVYRPSRVTRHMDAAAKFEDLNGEQKETLANLRTSYARDAAALNDKWASEIEAAEKKGGEGGEMAIAGGGMMRVQFGEGDDNSPLAQARKARRELDDKTRTRLESILTKEQREKLPKEPEGRAAGFNGQFVTDDAVRIGR